MLFGGGPERFEGYMRVSAMVGPVKLGTYEFYSEGG